MESANSGLSFEGLNTIDYKYETCQAPIFNKDPHGGPGYWSCDQWRLEEQGTMDLNVTVNWTNSEPILCTRHPNCLLGKITSFNDCGK